MTAFNHDGSVRWSDKLAVDNDTEQSAPIADGEAIFVGHTGVVSAIDARDGSVRWNASLGTSIYSLWLIDDVLVADVDQVSSDAKVVGLDPTSGATRWTYRVAGGGFVGDAVPTGDGALTFRSSPGVLTVLDASTGTVRWAKSTANGPNDEGLPSAGAGLVLYVDDKLTMHAFDDRSGVERWQVPAGAEGQVVVGANVGVVVPDVVSGPSITIVAHALDTGAELWRRDLADISAVFPEQGRFLLIDYRADTVTLADAASDASVWRSQLRKIDSLNKAPIDLPQSDSLAVVETNAIAFVDRKTGVARQVSVPTNGASNAVSGDGRLLLAGANDVYAVTAAGTQWRASLPHFAQRPPAALNDGGVAVQTEDPLCADGV